MGLPSEDRPPGDSNGTFQDDQMLGQNESGPNGHPHRRKESAEAEASTSHQQENAERSAEASSEQQVAERPRGNRKPSAAKEQRICGKCGNSLTGQFVRALGGTYHLECFTCHVSSIHVEELDVAAL